MSQIIDHLVTSGLCELADEKMQELLWRSTGGSVSSLVECIETLYDDSGLSDALEKPGTVYRDDLDDRLRSLGVLLSRITEGQGIDRLLQDPSLGLARELASRLLDDLRQLGYDAVD